jgi:DNA-binding response OmpR family regulator
MSALNAISAPEGAARRGKPRLMIVDDEPEIRAWIVDGLGREGYAVDPCANSSELDAALSAGPADLILLDVILPGEDGLSIARRLRAASGIPIIMLTGRDTIIDRVVGLEVGADDYLAKPFDLRELRARIRAVLRRSHPEKSPAKERSAQGAISFGKAAFDTDARCLRDACGEVIALTPTECTMLELFARNPNVVMSRERLLEPQPEFEVDALDRTIDIRIARLRKKVEVDPSKPTVIRTVRNAGYIFVPPRHAA